MNSRSSREQAVDSSQVSTSSDTELSGTSNGPTIASGCSRNESGTDTWTRRRSSAISAYSTISTPSDIEAWLMSSREASRANRTPLPASDSEPTTSETCGLRWSGRFAWYDHSTSTLRTSQGSLLTDTYPQWSGIWPASVIWDRTGFYPLPPLEQSTSAKDSGFGPHLREFPTPRATVYGSSGNGEGNNVTSRGRASLETMARKDVWPTPTAGDAKSSGSRNLEGSKAHPGVSLTDAVTSGGSSTARVEVGKGRLNPSWVEWLMGWPIGWTSLEPLAELEWHPIHAEPNIPRTTKTKTNRSKRLKALGNGQVPQCAAEAWRQLA